MELLARLKARRQAKAHLRHLRERERQQRLLSQDAQDAVKDIVRKAGPGSGNHNA
jgi:hypothetical protein